MGRNTGRKLAGRRIALVVLMSCAAAASAEQLPLKAYTTVDGLPHNGINRIVRDSRGFLWFGTADGLSRFDGYTFTNYTVEEGLPHRTVTDLLETRDHRYFVATGGGLARFDPAGVPAHRVGDSGPARPPARPMFTVVLHDDRDPLAQSITTLREDRRGTIWAGTARGLFRLEETAQRLVLRPVEIGIPRNIAEEGMIGGILEDRGGSLWIAAQSGLYRRWSDGSAARYTRREGLPDDYLHDLLEDHSGQLWAGTRRGGFFSFAANDSHAAPVVTRSYSIANGLPSNWVFRLLETKDHRLWIGTSNGLAELLEDGDGGENRFRIYDSRHGLSYHDVTALQEDPSGNLWVGTNTAGVMKLAWGGLVTYELSDGILSVNDIFEDQGGALCFKGGIPGGKRDERLTRFGRFDGRRFDWFKPAVIGDQDDLGWVMERVTLQTRDGEWWFGTHAGLYRFPPTARFTDIRSARVLARYTPKDGLKVPQVFRLFEDSRGNIWTSTISSEARGFARWERARSSWSDLANAPGLPSLKDDLPRSFGEDSEGNVWIGFDRGLARSRGEAFNLFTAIEGLPPGAILDIHRDRAGRLWLASASSGLIRVENAGSEHPAFVSYTTEQGLSSNRIEVIADDLYGRIFIGTGRGLDRLDPATGRIKHFTTADGLAPGIVRAAFRDRDGVMWFGTTGGLSRLVSAPDPPVVPPPVFVTGLVVDGGRRLVSSVGETAMSLPDLYPGGGQLQIDFVGLDFALGERLRYQYRLEGAEGDWSPPTEQRSVNYAHLAPGRYRFSVRALGSSAVVSSTPATVSFTVLPPIWQRWWFITLVLVAGGAATLAAYRYRIARVLELANVRTRIALDLHDDIGSNLTKIAILSEVARQQVSRGDAPDGPLSSIARISRESIAAMSDIVWAINPQRDRLLDLGRRMRRHAEEVAGARGIELTFRVPSEDQDIKLGVDVRRDLFLIFKEAINNVARHSRCSRVDVVLEADGKSLSLDVTDNGSGLEAPVENDGHGLASMRRRAEGLGGVFEVQGPAGTGTTVHVAIPLSGSRGADGPRKRVGAGPAVER